MAVFFRNQTSLKIASHKLTSTYQYGYDRKDAKKSRVSEEIVMTLSHLGFRSVYNFD